VQYSQSFNLSLEERVRRKLILAGILPKLFDLGQGAIRETVEAAGAGQFGRLHKEALNCTTALGTIYVQRMQANKRGTRGAKKTKTTRNPRRISLRIAITLPAALHLEAKRKASSLSMSFSEYMRSLIRKDLEVGQQ
jgi:hypothetical protein